jgi:predicted ArsR family transcriptional regulator
MAAKNTTTRHPKPEAHTAPDTAPPAGAAPSAAPAGSDPAAAIQAALAASPGAATATLAAAAGVSVTTARKTLNALEAAGHARRVPGEHTGRGKPPTTWHPTASPTPAATPAAHTEDIPGAPASTPAKAAGPDVETAVKLAELAATAAHHAATALQDGDITTALDELASARDHLTQARREAKAATARRARTGPVMGPGQLRDRVHAHLAANPGASLTPYEVSRVLGNSSGAIANALDKLTELGHAQLTSDHPRRYVTTTC